jgi:hypothetical protein
MTDERSRVYPGHLDSGSGFALWVSEMIQDEKQQFSRVRFSGVGVSDNDPLSEREHVSGGVARVNLVSG